MKYKGTLLKYCTALILAVIFVLGTYNIPLDFIKSLPDNIVITRSELAEFSDYNIHGDSIDDSNANPAFGPLDAVRSGLTSLKSKLKARIFGISYKTIYARIAEEQSLTLGGMPIGFNLNTKGVLVVGKNEILTEEGMVSPSTDAGIERGDMIISIQDNEVNSASEIAEVINKDENKDKALSIKVLRNDQTIDLTIKPALDKLSKKYLLGVWIRDNISGIGTVTYIEDNGRFGSLGHPVADVDTGVVFPISSGNVFNCKIIGVTKGAKGSPGELKGVFVKTDNRLGTADKNIKFGVFGNIENNIWQDNEKILNIGSRNGVKPGKAKIRCTVQDKIEEYDIEIIKTKKQNVPSEKGMIIRITDKRLLNQTGGIVQGMSGSPIIQNNKIVGAVTHVFLNDPTKGYGLYLDWMLGN